MIPVWNGWHFTGGFTVPCQFCRKQTKDVCLDPEEPREMRRYIPICSGCRRVLKRLGLLARK